MNPRIVFDSRVSGDEVRPACYCTRFPDSWYLGDEVNPLLVFDSRVSGDGGIARKLVYPML